MEDDNENEYGDEDSSVINVYHDACNDSDATGVFVTMANVVVAEGGSGGMPDLLCWVLSRTTAHAWTTAMRIRRRKRKRTTRSTMAMSLGGRWDGSGRAVGSQT